MTVNSILAGLYQSQDLEDCIRKTVRADHQKDFKHELFLLLYEKPADLILQLYNSSGLTYYVVRTVLNLVNQNRNRYHRNYLDTRISYDTESVERSACTHEHFDLKTRKTKEDREDEILREVQNGLNIRYDTFYYREIAAAVERYGGVRATERATGIPRTTISRALKIIREHLNKIYNDPDQIDGIY